MPCSFTCFGKAVKSHCEHCKKKKGIMNCSATFPFPWYRYETIETQYRYQNVLSHVIVDVIYMIPRTCTLYHTAYI